VGSIGLFVLRLTWLAFGVDSGFSALLCWFSAAATVSFFWGGVGSGLSALINVSLFFIALFSSAPPRQKRFLCCAFLDPLQGFSRVAYAKWVGFGLGHVALVCHSSTSYPQEWQ
jgi:hypothetical protein